MITTNPIRGAFETLLNSKNAIANIIQTIEYHKRLEKIIFSELKHLLAIPTSSSLLDGITLQSFKEKKLKLACKHAAISTQLRYLLPELQSRLRKQPAFSNLIQIELSISTNMPTQIQASESHGKQVKISPASALLLKNTLKYLKESKGG